MSDRTNLPESVVKALAVTDKLILHDRDVAKLKVYQWMEGDKHFNAWPGDGVTPPGNASCVELQLFNFPTGANRKITFSEGHHSPSHRNERHDCIMYPITVHQVEFVDTLTHASHPGDAALHPQGCMHNSATIIPGTRCEFAFLAQGKSGRDLVAFSGRDKPLHEVTEIVEGDKRVTIYGPTDKPGSKYRAKIFAFPGYTMVEAHLPKGNSLPSHRNGEEGLVYIVSGRLKVTTDTVTDEVTDGDFLRMVQGKPFAREALEDSVILELTGMPPVAET